MKQPRPIGVAWEFSDGRLKEQRCYGTFRHDMPDPDLRLNVLFVKHEGAFQMHSHEYAELVIALGGRATHLTETGDHPLEEGDVCVVRPNRRHGFRDASGLKLCNLQYDPRQFLRGQRALDKMMGYHALFDLDPEPPAPGNPPGPLRLTAEQMVYVTSLLAALKTELDGRNEGREIVIRSTFLLLVAHLSRLHASQRQDRRAPLIRMANVVAHIQTHYREALRIEQLARIAHLSASQFQRIFKRIYHTTPQQFIKQVRLRAACELLKDPNRDITDIAYETGFSSSSFFSTQFKGHLRESPSQYRRRHQPGISPPCRRVEFPVAQPLVDA